MTFSIDSQFIINDGSFNRVRLSLINNSILKVNGGEFKTLQIGFWGGASFKDVSIDFRQIKGHISVTGSQTQVTNLSLFQFGSESSISIEDIKVNCLSIYRFRNEKGFRILNVNALNSGQPSEFCIAESFLGKGEFYSVDFNSFNRFYVVDSQLTDCSFINVKWKFDIKAFKGKLIYKSQNENLLQEKIAQIEDGTFNDYTAIEELKLENNVKNYYAKSRENYRQLKYALSKQGDTINEQKFHSREILAYNNTLSISDSLGTKLIVKFSYWFSDFGQSITRPLIALLLGHWLLLMVVIFQGGIPNVYLSICNINKEGFGHGLYYYLSLINPLRKVDTITEKTIIIDLLMRIWSSYMIYNIVRATRRFIK